MDQHRPSTTIPVAPTGPAALHDLLDAAVSDSPDRIAVHSVVTGWTWTYAELDGHSRRMGRWLVEHGVRPDDRVAVVAPNRVELVPLIYAASRIGATFVLVDARTKPFQLRHILHDCDPRLVLADRVGLAGVQAASPVPVFDLDDAGRTELPPAGAGSPIDVHGGIACLIYTSGSTAMPKAVVEPHATMLFAAGVVAALLGYQADDRVLCCLPLSFDYGLYQVFLTTMARATLVLGDEQDAGPGLLRRLRDERISVLPAVPLLASTLVRLADRRHDPLPALRLLTNTGAVLPAATIRRLRQHFPTLSIVLMFGLTECKRVAVLEPDGDHARPGSVGRPLPGTTCWVEDGAGARMPPGEIGELVVAGPHVMAGYWRAPDLSAQRFHTAEDGTRRLRTGDYCRFDQDGYLYFVGRRDDIYKQRGTRVSALEVETAACDVDAVHDAAVLPPQSDEGAHLVVTADIEASHVLAELATRLPAFKLPTQCTVLDGLPRSTNGKVDRRALRALVDRRSG